MNKWAMVVCLMMTGCSMISTKYVRSAPGNFAATSPEQVGVFYSKADVPFKFHELGRVFIKRSNYWGDRDKGGQIESLRAKAAKEGADAIIVIDSNRYEAAGFSGSAGAGAQAGDVYAMSAVAIAKD